MNKKYSYIKIGLASPEEIRSWSHGEVKKHETINYRTLKPEEDGLFCERIFGPTKDYQCACGKTKRNQDKGSVCDKCGVEITESKVRRERMAHIELAAPVVHTWYLKNSPSRLAILLDIKAKDLEEVVYLASYIVIEPGETGLAKKQTINESTYSELYEKYGNTFKALTGAEAVKELLKSIDLEKERNVLRKKLKSKSKQKLEKITKRLEVVESFIESDNKPEWMVLDVLPVIPPDLRPMVQLDGGRFATTDLNDLYRRILNRNNRLKKQKEQNAPHLIIKNEKRMLQEAVDALIDSSKRGKRGAGDKTKQPKSLSDMLRGKQGRFRQNLLGKRVDYSARSVIVIGPSLKMYQCGIPREMAVTLFKPFIIRELMKSQDVVMGNAKKMIEKGDDKVWEVLDKVIKEHPVLLNRAPTLHRLGIQAFEPVLVEGKAIRLHPLVTTAFNADFDGDQMAVHVPLSYEAQAEARLLMLASNNILNPKDGKPIVTPSQDMVLGNYYLTMEKPYNDNGVIDEAQALEGHVFSGYDEAYMAYKNNEITLHTRIAVPIASIDREFKNLESDDMYLLTTLGKMIFNNNIPKTFPYVNEPSNENLTKTTPRKYIVKRGVNIKELYANSPIVDPFKKKFLQQIIAEVFKRYQFTETSRMLDRIKDLGFFYSTVSGITISAFDVQVYSKKKDELAKAEAKVDMINGLYENYGVITDRERYKLVTEEWERVRKFIEKDLQKELKKDNHIFMMKDSGARGNDSNFSQLAGMRGLMNNPEGDVIEVPIKGSFREGITGTEYFISTHGARKGSTDTALKTAESGYLTRRLVDVAQDVIVSEVDCKTERGLLFEDIKDDSGKVVAKMAERIIGRTASKDVINPETGEVIVKRNEEISNDKAAEIENAGIEAVFVRTALTCSSSNGVCMKCYGRNLSTNLTVEVGEAIGTIAAQSIGEPGTQLTMRTFHTGGVASAADITQGLPRVQELFEARNPKGKSPISEIHGILKDVQPSKSNYVMIIEGTDADAGTEKKYLVDGKSERLFQVGDKIERGQKLVKGSIAPKELLRSSYTDDVQKYILEEVLKVYQAQGVEIGDKHIEIIIRQMMRKVVVDIEGDTELLPRSEASINEFKDQVKGVLAKGGKLPVAKPIVLGITRASLRSDSFLSAASFQETTRILTDAAIKSKKDPLLGLKENVIIGGLIPAGTGKLDHEFYSAPQAIVEEDLDEAVEEDYSQEADDLFEEMTQGDDAEAFVVETASNDLD